jgi:hypothetical protein
MKIAKAFILGAPAKEVVLAFDREQLFSAVFFVLWRNIIKKIVVRQSRSFRSGRWLMNLIREGWNRVLELWHLQELYCWNRNMMDMSVSQIYKLKTVIGYDNTCVSFGGLLLSIRIFPSKYHEITKHGCSEYTWFIPMYWRNIRNCWNWRRFVKGKLCKLYDLSTPLTYKIKTIIKRILM